MCRVHSHLTAHFNTTAFFPSEDTEHQFTAADIMRAKGLSRWCVGVCVLLGIHETNMQADPGPDRIRHLSMRCPKTAFIRIRPRPCLSGTFNWPASQNNRHAYLYYIRFLETGGARSTPAHMRGSGKGCVDIIASRKSIAQRQALLAPTKHSTLRPITADFQLGSNLLWFSRHKSNFPTPMATGPSTHLVCSEGEQEAAARHRQCVYFVRKMEWPMW